MGRFSELFTVFAALGIVSIIIKMAKAEPDDYSNAEASDLVDFVPLTVNPEPVNPISDKVLARNYGAPSVYGPPPLIGQPLVPFPYAQFGLGLQSFKFNSGPGWGGWTPPGPGWGLPQVQQIPLNFGLNFPGWGWPGPFIP